VVPSEAGEWSVETLAHAKLVETNRHNGAVSVLLAHIVATRCRGDVITDADMDYPSDWRSRKGRPADVGHQDEGRTVAVHSFAVLPRLHGCGIGKMLMRAYLQQMNNSGLASRVALICQEVGFPSVTTRLNELTWFPVRFAVPRVVL
jgi:GNAT superfamily N-acetyltransferase